MAAADLPYDEFDPPIVGLVRTLNELPGIETTSSCGGGEGHSEPPDRWHVGFRLEVEDPRADLAWPTPDAWLSMEWLTWFVNGNLRRSTGIELELNSFPPFINQPGRSIYFMVNGRRGENGLEPDEFAEKIKHWAVETDFMEAWPDA